MVRGVASEVLDAFSERFLNGGEINLPALSSLVDFIRRHYEEFILPEENSVWQPRGYDELFYKEECAMIGRIVEYLRFTGEGLLGLYTGNQGVVATRHVKKMDTILQEEVQLNPHVTLPISSCDHQIVKIRQPSSKVVSPQLHIGMKDFARSIYNGGDLVVQQPYPWIFRALGSGAFAAGEVL
jgi:hypothetical protein